MLGNDDIGDDATDEVGFLATSTRTRTREKLRMKLKKEKWNLLSNSIQNISVCVLFYLFPKKDVVVKCYLYFYLFLLIFTKTSLH